MRLGRTVRARNTQSRWLGRLIRGLRPDRNPLRRTSDRVESYLLAGLLVAALAGAPFAVRAASHAAYAGALRAEQAQLAALHQVRAVITGPAGNDNSGYTLSTEEAVRAAWTTPAGERRTADILVLAGTPKGTAVTIWTDAQGNLSNPPLQPSQVAGQSDVAALGAIIAVVALYLCATGIVRSVMYRRRMAAWAADWAVTAPTWNRQRW
jgi:hypothetical protein